MYSLNVVHKQKTKKITLPRNISKQDLLALISQSFRLKQKLIGLANDKGQLITIDQLPKRSEKQTLYLITAQDMNGDNMSFASDGGDNIRQNFMFEEEKQPGFSTEGKVEIPQKGEGNYQGVIGDMELFESLFLQQGKMTIVLCFIKEKPRNFMFPYYLYHTAKNSVIIYMGRQRICQFFVQWMNEIPTQVTRFIKSSLGEYKQKDEYQYEQQKKSTLLHKPFSKKRSRNQLKQVVSSGVINRGQLQRDFYQDDDNKQDQQLLNEFGDQQPVEVREQEEIYDEMDDQYQEQLPIFEQQQLQQQQQQYSTTMGNRDNRKLQQQQQIQQRRQQQSNNRINNIIQSEQINYDQRHQLNNQKQQIKVSLLENLLKLKQHEDITQLEFYKMKSELLENLSDFMRKYQMGTRKGFRGQSYGKGKQRQQTKQEKRGKKQSNQLKSRGEKERPMSPMSSSDSSDLIAPQRPQQKLRQRLKHPQPRYTSRASKQLPSHKQHRNQRQQRQQKQLQVYQKKHNQSRPSNPVPLLNNRESSPPLKDLTTPFSNDRMRSKKYEIPIIVRKYNNVIEKISTSYPLSQQQQQAINLILQLQLKGLITQKQSGVYKSSILQQDKDVFPLFLDYFDHLIDQLQLVSKLKNIKRINSEKKERSQHNMRLLIKYAKQSSYQMLRSLLLDNNHLVLAALDKFRGDKDGDGLTTRLEKIAQVYLQKTELENEVFDC